MSPRKKIAQAYIDLLAEGKVEEVIALFHEDGIVVSPLYGKQSAQDFYRALSGDTNSSALSVLGILEDPDLGKIALHFEYDWVLKNGTRVVFEVVDMLSFTSDNQISELRIIYDTVQARNALDAQRASVS